MKLFKQFQNIFKERCDAIECVENKKSKLLKGSTYLWTEAGSEGHGGGGSSHGMVTHGGADDRKRWGEAVDGWVELTRGGAHGGRGEEGRV